jgi:hypothetical protein
MFIYIYIYISSTFVSFTSLYLSISNKIKGLKFLAVKLGMGCCFKRHGGVLFWGWGVGGWVLVLVPGLGVFKFGSRSKSWRRDRHMRLRP